MNEPLRQRQATIEDPAHLDFVRGKPCCVCGRRPRSAAAHVRYGDPSRGKPATGMQQRPSDCWTVPLCDPGCHKEAPDAQHGTNERRWWEAKGVDPIALSERLWIESGAAERHRFDAPGPAVRKPRKARPRPPKVKRAWAKREFPKGRGFNR